jgi:hypothetical protein
VLSARSIIDHWHHRHHRHRWAVVSLLGPLGLIYGSLIWNDPILERDDLNVISKAKGFSDYLELLTTGRSSELFFLHPILDFTYWLDSRSESWGSGTFHLTNLLIWLLALGFAWAILDKISQKSVPILYPLLCLTGIAVHPVSVASVAWVAARKHLLSTTFILGATWALLKFRDSPPKSLPLVLGFFVAALVTHPTPLLWPLWAITLLRVTTGSWEKSWKPARSLLPCFALLIFSAGINWQHYSSSYVATHSTSKILSWIGASPEHSLLAWGRYAWNLLLPTHLAALYYPGSIFNILGTLLLIPLILLALRVPRAGVWLALGLVGILPTTLVITNVFVSDTYALLGVFGLGFALFVLLTEGLQTEPMGLRRVRVLGTLVVLALSLQSARLARTWLSDLALWEHSHRVEPTPRSAAALAAYLIRAGRPEEALRWVQQLKNWEPGAPELPELFREMHATGVVVNLE